MKTALIIEDTEDNRVLISRLLDKSGYFTYCAETGLDGYELASNKLPDFIILDIQLPDIEGTEVLQLLRASDQTKHIPVICMTSFAMAGDRERLIGKGCNAYIEKPINPETVISQIERILDPDPVK